MTIKYPATPATGPATRPITGAVAAAAPPLPGISWRPPVARLAALTALAFALPLWLGLSQNWRIGALSAIGGLIGVLLYITAFGFTGSLRRMIVFHDVAGAQAMIPMLALATLLFAPVLASGQAFGHGVTGALAPLGLSVAAGAFLFGLGMQLGGACGSGTLVTVGGGSTRMIVTLAAFCTGSFWASLDMQWWLTRPRLEAISLGEELGWPLGVAVQLVFLAVIWFALERWRASGNGRKLSRQTWLLLAGAMGLALFNWLTLLISGHPWSITWGFTLWGAKTAQALGWNPSDVWFWTGGFTERALGNSIFADETSVMDMGIILGAFAAALAFGRLSPGWRIGWAPLATAIIGGLLMGYGARIAFGCNIGAFFSGVASTSLHGWLWIACALAGMWLGIRLHTRFKLGG